MEQKKALGCRSMTDQWIEFFRQKTNPLVVVTVQDWVTSTKFVQDLHEKTEALRNKTENQVLIWVRTGKRRSDAFDITDEWIEKLL